MCVWIALTRHRMSYFVLIVLTWLTWEPMKTLIQHTSGCVWVSHAGMTLDTTYCLSPLPLWKCYSALLSSAVNWTSLLHHTFLPCFPLEVHLQEGWLTSTLSLWTISPTDKRPQSRKRMCSFLVCQLLLWFGKDFSVCHDFMYWNLILIVRY